MGRLRAGGWLCLGYNASDSDASAFDFVLLPILRWCGVEEGLALVEAESLSDSPLETTTRRCEEHTGMFVWLSCRSCFRANAVSFAPASSSPRLLRAVLPLLSRQVLVLQAGRGAGAERAAQLRQRQGEN